MAGKTRRTPEQQEEAIEVAKSLLDIGASRKAIVVQLQRRFSLSRSAAYRDVMTAIDERGSEGIEATGGFDLRMTAQIVEQALLTASIEGDLKEISRLAKTQLEIHKAMGMALIRTVTSQAEVGGDAEEAEAELA